MYKAFLSAFFILAGLRPALPQDLPAWQFISKSQEELADALFRDERSFENHSSHDLDEILAASAVPGQRSREVTALVTLPEYANKLVDTWDDPYSVGGVGHILLAPAFVCPRYNEPDQLQCWQPGIETCARRLVKRMFEDARFREQYRKFLVWSGMLFVREPLGRSIEHNTRNTLSTGLSSLAQDVRSADRSSWRQVLRGCCYAAILGKDDYFAMPATPENVRLRTQDLMRFYERSNFSPRPDGFGWVPASEGESPNQLKALPAEGVVGAKLYDDETFDQAVRWLLITNAGSGAFAELLANAIETQ